MAITAAEAQLIVGVLHQAGLAHTVRDVALALEMRELALLLTFVAMTE